MTARWPVMVLAHNEERHIAACLDSIFAADPEREFDIFVMANGCTDRTVEIVSKYRAHRRGFRLREVPIIFVERRWGLSKNGLGSILGGMWAVWALRVGRP